MCGTKSLREQKVSELNPPCRLPLLCTTAEGWLQRVVILGTETHVIEEIQLFETAQPVDSLTISHSKVRRKGIGCLSLIFEELHRELHPRRVKMGCVMPSGALVELWLI